MASSFFPSKRLSSSFLLLSIALGIGPGDADAQHIPLVLAPQLLSASVMRASAVEDPGRFSAPFLPRRGQDVGVERKRGSADPIEAESIGSGPAFVALGSIAVEADGALIVLDAGLRAVFRVDPLTGDRTIISGCTVSTTPCPAAQLNGLGPPLEQPHGIAVERPGTLVVADLLLAAVIRINPVTGDRTVISGCTEAIFPAPCPAGQLIGSGPAIMVPQSIAVEPTGTLVVTTRFETIGVLRIDPLTGNRDVLAAFPAHIGAFSFLGPLPRGIAVEADGSLVVAEDVQLSFRIPYDGSFGYSIRGAVTRVNANTGARTIVSTDRRFDPLNIAVEAAGSLVVTEIDFEAIVRVHPISGERVIVSGCTIVAPLCPAQQLVGGGPVFTTLIAVAVEAEGTLVATDTGRKAIIRVDPISGDRAILSQ